MHTEDGAPGAGGRACDPGEELLVLAGAAVAAAAGDDQGVERRGDVLEAACRGDRETAGCAREGVAAHERDLVARRGATAFLAGAIRDRPVGAGEDLQRPRDVQALDTRIHQDRHSAGIEDGIHGVDDGPPGVCPQGPIAHLFCHANAPVRTLRTLVGGRGTFPPHRPLASRRMDDPDFSDGDEDFGGDPDSLSSAPGRVASIVSAAEAAAADLREHAESKANARIAEADRAADNRVAAADEEAEELLATIARAQAEAMTAEASDTVARMTGELEQARDEAVKALADAREQAQRQLAEARSESEGVVRAPKRKPSGRSSPPSRTPSRCGPPPRPTPRRCEPPPRARPPRCGPRRGTLARISGIGNAFPARLRIRDPHLAPYRQAAGLRALCRPGAECHQRAKRAVRRRLARCGSGRQRADLHGHRLGGYALLLAATVQ